MELSPWWLLVIVPVWAFIICLPGLLAWPGFTLGVISMSRNND